MRIRLRNDAIALIEAEGLVEDAAYSYNIVALERPATAAMTSFLAGGETINAPLLLPASGELTALGCGACTIGPQLGQRSTSLFAEKRASLAIALDEVGNEMLFALGRRLQDRMLSETMRKRLTMAGELHAGDPGLDISAQAAVLRLAGGDSIGIGLHQGHLLTPLKSGSVVYGVGKNLPEVSWSRCDSCPSKEKCSLGRRPKKLPPPALQLAAS
ncbi:MAG: hypothetical protein EKK46_10745 [Rhodocyclaceae bacterium]|nr:MAG: hypothetical protein EKK46_10745 [Rhodocyclaceae bacterium]